MNVGVKLCFTIFTSSVATNIDVVTSIGKVIFNRFRDRSFKQAVKKDVEDELDDEPRSKMATQDELEALYKGGEFEGQKSFSRMMSTLAVCILYSSGMPSLYLVGFIFFAATYFVNKVAIFHYY